MANILKKPKRKKMVDIIQPISVHLKDKEFEPKSIEKNIKEDLRKIDKQVEEFTKKEEKQFKEEEKPERKFRPKKFRIKTYVFIGLLLAVLGGGIYSAVEFLPKAEIKSITKKTEWNYVDSVIANKNITKIDVGQKRIPAEIFSIRKNFNFSFPATGKKIVQEKAGGKIIIYNAYSSEPQRLVATTRFATPDGKIFRLVKEIMVPAAKIVEGKIVASSIEATVVADQAGPKYNIEPVSHFSIPGFQGSAKYQGFYAESKEAMKGGFIGEKAFPTEEDIKKAKEKASQDLRDSVESFLSLQTPPEFKIIEGSKQFNLLKQEVNQQVDEKNNFTVFSEAELLNIAFKESDLKNLIEETAKAKLGTNFKIKTYNLEYGVGRADFKQGQISFAVNFQGVFEEPFNVEDFRQKSVTKSETNLRALISSFPNIQKATISFWPFWVKRAPDDIKRVKVEVE